MLLEEVMKEMARLPTAAADLTRIRGDTFAAYSAGRVIVFSTEKILGLASCVATSQ
jgi:hypothetical protein